MRDRLQQMTDFAVDVGWIRNRFRDFLDQRVAEPPPEAVDGDLDRTFAGRAHEPLGDGTSSWRRYESFQ